MPLAENQTLANCVNPTLHICVPEFSWSLATLLHLDLWSYCFSMIYCSTGTLISFSHTILHYDFCVSQDFYSVYNWSWDTCIVVVLSCLFSCHISKHIQHLLLIFSLVYTSYLIYIRTVYFFLPYIEIEVGSSFFVTFFPFFDWNSTFLQKKACISLCNQVVDFAALLRPLRPWWSSTNLMRWPSSWTRKFI